MYIQIKEICIYVYTNNQNMYIQTKRNKTTIFLVKHIKIPNKNKNKINNKYY